MKSVAWPVVEAGRLEVEVLDQQQAGRADRLDRERAALGHDEPLLVAEPRGHRGGDQEEDEAGVREQRRHLRVLVAVAVEVARAVVGRSPRGRGSRCAAGRSARRRPRPPSIAARSGRMRVEERLRLGDPDVADAAPQPRRPVERADDDRDDEHDERGAEPRRAEDREDRQPLQGVDDARPEERVVAGVQVLERGRVVRRRAEGEVGQLPDRHPDDRQQRQEDDLERRRSRPT